MQSTASAVLPIARSPMISSRWPRPRANIESTTSRPVCTGWLTKSRSMIPGAGRSIGSVASALTGPSPSSGRPSGSRTRPSRPRPTGTRATSPVPWTAPPASIPSKSSRSTQPTRSRSRVSAKPISPPAKRTSSLSRRSARPETSAMPSATLSTRPICSIAGRQRHLAHSRRGGAQPALDAIRRVLRQGSAPSRCGRGRRASCCG